MSLVYCPRCHGTGQEAYHGPSGVSGDTSTDWIDCRVCNGSGRVSTAWRAAWQESGMEMRCDECRKLRPVAIMRRHDGIVILCAACAPKG